MLRFKLRRLVKYSKICRGWRPMIIWFNVARLCVLYWKESGQWFLPALVYNIKNINKKRQQGNLCKSLTSMKFTLKSEMEKKTSNIIC